MFLKYFNRKDDTLAPIVRGAIAAHLDNPPFTMAAIAPAFRRWPPNICHMPGIGRPGLIHSLNAGCEFQINKSDLRSRTVHDRVRVR
ncbi:hypothetical protein MESS4_430217 [Mesorhizobium sp. STM 4661]|nr:hypothetical protein MESS4_430217 [Mesorhizobium sp. STM 4661]